MRKLTNLVFYFIIHAYYSTKNRMLTNRLSLFLKKSFWYSYLKYFGVETEFGEVTLDGLPIIRKHKKSRIVLGKNVVLVSKSSGNIAGVNHPVILATLSENAQICIGDNVGISGSSICAVEKVIIGDQTNIGVNSSLYDTDFHALDAMINQKKNILDAKFGKIEIGSKVWIGANVMVLKGVAIGDETVIGAGSVVKKNIPPKSLAIGNPAVVVRHLKQDEFERNNL